MPICFDFQPLDVPGRFRVIFPEHPGRGLAQARAYPGARGWRPPAPVRCMERFGDVAPRVSHFDAAPPDARGLLLREGPQQALIPPLELLRRQRVGWHPLHLLAATRSLGAFEPSSGSRSTSILVTLQGPDCSNDAQCGGPRLGVGALFFDRERGDSELVATPCRDHSLVARAGSTAMKSVQFDLLERGGYFRERCPGSGAVLWILTNVSVGWSKIAHVPSPSFRASWSPNVSVGSTAWGICSL
jgi:hypothetical protein